MNLTGGFSGNTNYSATLGQQLREQRLSSGETVQVNDRGNLHTRVNLDFFCQSNLKPKLSNLRMDLIIYFNNPEVINF